MLKLHPVTTLNLAKGPLRGSLGGELYAQLALRTGVAIRVALLEPLLFLPRALVEQQRAPLRFEARFGARPTLRVEAPDAISLPAPARP